MANKKTYRLILKDSENRAVSVNCKNTPMNTDLSLLLINYTSLLQEKEAYKVQLKENNKEVENRAAKKAKAVAVLGKADPTKRVRRSRRQKEQ